MWDSRSSESSMVASFPSLLHLSPLNPPQSPAEWEQANEGLTNMAVTVAVLMQRLGEGPEHFMEESTPSLHQGFKVGSRVLKGPARSKTV